MVVRMPSVAMAARTFGASSGRGGGGNAKPPVDRVVRGREDAASRGWVRGAAGKGYALPKEMLTSFQFTTFQKAAM